jgi:hypothetical protein
MALGGNVAAYAAALAQPNHRVAFHYDFNIGVSMM